MKKMRAKYILPILFLGLVACDVDNTLSEIKRDSTSTEKIALNANGLDFSKYVAIGSSFTAGFTDGALFKAAQENSFPNTLSKKFAMAGGGSFNQPLMNDNIGGLLFGKTVIQYPRLYFNGKAPVVLLKNLLNPEEGIATPTTKVSNFVTEEINNFGIPGAKSFHFVADNYGSVDALKQNRANPYFVRMNPGSKSVLTTILSNQKKPTFFTLSEFGGNDVLGYALSGGTGKNQTGNQDLKTYGNTDITDPSIFANVLNTTVNALLQTGAKGVVTTVPYINSLAHFTTVPHNPLDPNTNESFKAQVPALNQIYGALNQVYKATGQTNRTITFSETKANPVVVFDESLPDLSKTIAQALIASGPVFEGLVTQFGLPVQAAPKVASLLGRFYGQSRQATSQDLLVLPSSGVIGTVDTESVAFLVQQGLSKEIAERFSVQGVTKPLADKWVLTPKEQTEIKTATDAYNKTITTVANGKGLALVDFKAILENAAASGITFDEYNLTTNLVTGGLISLDGVHLTARGYALMANEILKATDTKYGSNFAKATGGLAKATDFPTNYSPLLR